MTPKMVRRVHAALEAGGVWGFEDTSDEELEAVARLFEADDRIARTQAVRAAAEVAQKYGEPEIRDAILALAEKEG